MIAGPDASSSQDERRRLLLSGAGSAPPGVLTDLCASYPEWIVTSSQSHLDGIAQLSRSRADAILAWIDSPSPRLQRAVGGLREAAGEAKLILCCSPETEPMAREARSQGADDYVLFPFDPDELDVALGLPRVSMETSDALTDAPAATMDELAGLAELLANLDTKPSGLLSRIASLVASALETDEAAIVVEGAVAQSGEEPVRAVLSAPLLRDDRTIGHISVGARQDHAYSPGDVAKLAHYGTLIGRILEAASKQRSWRQLAVTDECSGLPNRRHLITRLDEILARAEEDRFPVSLLLFDVDDFKTYNDAYGHDAGDEIIRVTGELFAEHCRDQDVVARYGGDEFAVVFWDPDGPRVSGSSHPEGALAVLQRFNATLRSHRFPLLGPSGTGKLTISGGIATYPWDATGRSELITRADEALLAAKRAGKNRIFLIGQADRP